MRGKRSTCAYQFHTQSPGQRFGATINKKRMAGLRIWGLNPRIVVRAAADAPREGRGKQIALPAVDRA
jgi:hypothetical protein